MHRVSASPSRWTGSGGRWTRSSRDARNPKPIPTSSPGTSSASRCGATTEGSRSPASATAALRIASASSVATACSASTGTRSTRSTRWATGCVPHTVRRAWCCRSDGALTATTSSCRSRAAAAEWPSRQLVGAAPEDERRPPRYAERDGGIDEPEHAVLGFGRLGVPHREQEEVHDDVARVGPAERQRPAPHPPAPDGVGEERDAEQRTQDDVGRARQALAEEHESRVLPPHLQRLQQVRDPEQREQHRRRGEERATFPHETGSLPRLAP